MGEFTPLAVSLIGIFGVLAGALLNEVLRRRNRVEMFAPVIFERRLEAYEGLVVVLYECMDIANDVLSSPDLTREQREILNSEIIEKLGEYCDPRRLYLNRDLTMHCFVMFVGIHQYYSAARPGESKLIKKYYKMARDAFRMIEEDSGITELERLFSKINRPKIDSDVIQFERKYQSSRRSQ